MKSKDLPGCKLNIVDLLCTFPSSLDFSSRVRRLQLPAELEARILHCVESSEYMYTLQRLDFTFTEGEESTLAAEVLYYRHKFTRCVAKNRKFRQASLTIIQNIYLFNNRHIFFQPSAQSLEEERRQALELFSTPYEELVLPVSKSLRHPVLARIWARIVSQTESFPLGDPAFLELHSIVESLNTLRNIYMLFSTRLIRKLAGSVNPVYKQSISYNDAVQIGSFGIARAAYRYHQSMGIRFSTYAARWFHKEIQRQALSGRLIRISADTVEMYAKAKRDRSKQFLCDSRPSLSDAIPDDNACAYLTHAAWEESAGKNCLQKQAESRQLEKILLDTVNCHLTEKNADIIKRRYGLPPYTASPQSVVEIAEVYKITRGRVYQIERDILNSLRKTLLQKHSEYEAL